MMAGQQHAEPQAPGPAAASPPGYSACLSPHRRPGCQGRCSWQPGGQEHRPGLVLFPTPRTVQACPSGPEGPSCKSPPLPRAEL